MTETLMPELAKPKLYVNPDGVEVYALLFDGTPFAAASIHAWLGRTYDRYDADTETLVLNVADAESHVRAGLYVTRIRGARYVVPWNANRFDGIFREKP